MAAEANTVDYQADKGNACKSLNYILATKVKKDHLKARK